MENQSTQPPSSSEPRSGSEAEVGLAQLRAANVERQAEWCPGVTLPDLSFRGNELAGETGEACNVIKKLERERHGWRGSRDSVEHLAEELADVIITTDLVAISAGIDLAAAVAAKFNATSIKQGLATRLALQSDTQILDFIEQNYDIRNGKGLSLRDTVRQQMQEEKGTGYISAALPQNH